MSKKRILFSVLEIGLGVWMFIYGGYDDSPGAQGLGLLAIVLGVWGLLRNRKKS